MEDSVYIINLIILDQKETSILIVEYMTSKKIFEVFMIFKFKKINCIFNLDIYIDLKIKIKY